MRLALVLSLTALFAGYLALLVLRQKLRDRATQKRFTALQLHHLVSTDPLPLSSTRLRARVRVQQGAIPPLFISGPAHSQERYDSLARLIRSRTWK